MKINEKNIACTYTHSPPKAISKTLMCIDRRPKTEPTRQAYEQLLNFLSTFMGDQPNDILRGAADEVLAVVKDDTIVGPAKQKQVLKQT